MAIPGKLELTVKINVLPDAEKVQDGWFRFFVETGPNAEIMMTMRPRVWNRLVQAAQRPEPWVATITGPLGPRTPKGFILLNPGVQVRQPSVTPEQAQAPAEPASGDVAHAASSPRG